MSIIECLTQEELKHILLTIYKKGQESEQVNVKDFVNEIKLEFMSSNTLKD